MPSHTAIDRALLRPTEGDVVVALLALADRDGTVALIEALVTGGYIGAPLSVLDVWPVDRVTVQ